DLSRAGNAEQDRATAAVRSVRADSSIGDREYQACQGDPAVVSGRLRADPEQWQTIHVRSSLSRCRAAFHGAVRLASASRRRFGWGSLPRLSDSAHTRSLARKGAIVGATIAFVLGAAAGSQLVHFGRDEAALSHCHALVRQIGS